MPYSYHYLPSRHPNPDNPYVPDNRSNDLEDTFLMTIYNCFSRMSNLRRIIDIKRLGNGISLIYSTKKLMENNFNYHRIVITRRNEVIC
jgi:hypothetical protein